MKRAVFFIAMLMLILKVTGQVTSSGSQLYQYLESNALFDAETGLLDDLNDEISSLMEKPVDINSRDEDEIGRLFFLTLFQVKSIIAYSKAKGSIISPYEIAYIPGFDAELASIMSQFIITSVTNINGNRSFYTRNKLLFNLILKEPLNYNQPGNDLKSLLKISHSSGQVSMGVTAEKDRGERFLDESGSPDFISGYIRFSGKQHIRNLIIGDFKVRFGQGLIVWTGYSAGTSPLVESPMKGVSNLLPYSSTNENDFFRGVAASVKAGKLNIHAYVSENNIDAVTLNGIGGDAYIRSFPDDGLHNTMLTLSRKDAVTEQSAGFNLNMIFEKLYIGVTATGTKFSVPVLDDGTTSGQFDFKGNRNLSMSADWVLNLKNLYLYGEYAFNPGGATGLLQGLRLTPANHVKFNILYANTSNGYNSFHGNLLGKETVNTFRQSLLANIYFEPASYTRMGTGILIYKNHWYTGFSQPPSTTIKWGLSLRFVPDSSWSLNAEANFRKAPRYILPETGVKKITYNYLAGGRISLILNPLYMIKLTTRIHLTRSLKSPGTGLLCYQTMRLTPPKMPIKLIMRLTLFNISDYDCRIYAWEDDLLFSPVISPFSGNGTRSYMLMEYKFRKVISLRLKYGVTRKANGNKTISVPTRELKFQAIIDF